MAWIEAENVVFTRICMVRLRIVKKKIDSATGLYRAAVMWKRNSCRLHSNNLFANLFVLHCFTMKKKSNI